jgi:hypothetical protein
MSDIQKKQDVLIQEIRNTDDVEVLELLKTVLDSRLKTYKLSDDEVLMVKESRKQIKQGKSKTQEEVIEGMTKWLGDK